MFGFFCNDKDELMFSSADFGFIYIIKTGV